MTKLRSVVTDAASGFVAHECLSRGAAIAYYTVFSIAPLLVISIAIAGLVFGDDAARGAVADQLRGLLGDQAAEAVQAMIQGASDTGRGTLATVIGVATLLVTASGTFSEMQGALNAIWGTKAPPQEENVSAVQVVSRFVKAKAAAVGLVAATGFLLLVSLIVSAAVSAFNTWLGDSLPGWALLAQVLGLVVPFVFITLLFAAIYKVLPDRDIAWRDVLLGAAVTALLFTIGKTLIGWYIGSGAIASSFGAAGSLAVLLLWVYYSAQIFLLGAEFTRAWAGMEAAPVPEAAEAGSREPRRAERPHPPRLGWARAAGLVSLALLRARDGQRNR